MYNGSSAYDVTPDAPLPKSTVEYYNPTLPAPLQRTRTVNCNYEDEYEYEDECAGAGAGADEYEDECAGAGAGADEYNMNAPTACHGCETKCNSCFYSNLMGDQMQTLDDDNDDATDPDMPDLISDDDDDDDDHGDDCDDSDDDSIINILDNPNFIITTSDVVNAIMIFIICHVFVYIFKPTSDVEL